MSDNLTATIESEAIQVIARFNDAWNARDLDQVMSLMTDDCVFENTAPGPDGERHEGQAAVRAVWQSIFQTPGMRFETEEEFSCGDRVTGLWRYSWANADGTTGHIRGVDVFRIQDGKIAEKLSYVKG